MAAKDEMRRKIQKSQNALREKKRKEREEAKKNKPYVSPFERKHGRKPSRSDDMVSKKTRSSKPKTKVQERFKKRVSEGKSGFTGGPKGETVAEYRARQEKKIKEAARKRHEAFKAKRKLKIKNK